MQYNFIVHHSGSLLAGFIYNEHLVFGDYAKASGYAVTDHADIGFGNRQVVFL